MAISATNVKLRSGHGDQEKVTQDLTNITGTDEYIVPHIREAEDYVFTPTTEVDYGITASGNTLTFATSSTIAGKLTVYGR